jgi:hypothetical protein
MNTFEDRLLADLTAIVRANPAPDTSTRPLRRPLYLAGGATAVGVATAAVLIADGGASPAWAVAEQGRTVTVTVHSLKDAAGLQKALIAHGLKADVTFVPAGKTCAPGRFIVSGPQSGRTSGSVRGGDGPATFSFSLDDFEDGQTLVLEDSVGTSVTSMSVAVATGTVGPCVLVDAPAVPAPGGPGVVTSGDGQGPTLTQG